MIILRDRYFSYEGALRSELPQIQQQLAYNNQVRQQHQGEVNKLNQAYSSKLAPKNNVQAAAVMNYNRELGNKLATTPSTVTENWKSAGKAIFGLFGNLWKNRHSAQIVNNGVDENGNPVLDVQKLSVRDRLRNIKNDFKNTYNTSKETQVQNRVVSEMNPYKPIIDQRTEDEYKKKMKDIDNRYNSMYKNVQI